MSARDHLLGWPSATHHTDDDPLIYGLGTPRRVLDEQARLAREPAMLPGETHAQFVFRTKPHFLPDEPNTTDHTALITLLKSWVTPQRDLDDADETPTEMADWARSLFSGDNYAFHQDYAELELRAAAEEVRKHTKNRSEVTRQLPFNRMDQNPAVLGIYALWCSAGRICYSCWFGGLWSSVRRDPSEALDWCKVASASTAYNAKGWRSLTNEEWAQLEAMPKGAWPDFVETQYRAHDKDFMPLRDADVCYEIADAMLKARKQ